MSKEPFRVLCRCCQTTLVLPEPKIQYAKANRRPGDHVNLIAECNSCGYENEVRLVVTRED